MFAERLAEPLPELDAAAAMVPDPSVVKGQAMTDAIAGRARAKAAAIAIREALLLVDPEPDDG